MAAPRGALGGEGNPVAVTSPERDAVIAAGWPAGTIVKRITAEVNRLPGQAMTTAQVGMRANRLGLHRPPRFNGTNVTRPERGPAAPRLPDGLAQPAPATLPRESGLPQLFADLARLCARVARALAEAEGVAPTPPLLPAITRDGLPSPAARQLAEHDAAQLRVTVIWEDAEEWGHRHAPVSLTGSSRRGRLALINQAREHFGLPHFHIRAARAPFEPLPAAHVEAAE